MMFRSTTYQKQSNEDDEEEKWGSKNRKFLQLKQLVGDVKERHLYFYILNIGL